MSEPTLTEAAMQALVDEGKRQAIAKLLDLAAAARRVGERASDWDEREACEREAIAFESTAQVLEELLGLRRDVGEAP